VLLAKLSISGFQNPNLIMFSASTLHIHLTIQCLFYLFLLVLRLLAGQVPSCWVVVLHKITSTTEVGVSVAKTQCPWTVVVEPWMSTLFPNQVILCLYRKIGIQPSWVSIKWYPERGWSVWDFLFYRKFFSYSPEKPKKYSRLVPSSPFEPFTSTARLVEFSAASVTSDCWS
jgi:hypothetical protein